MKNIVGIDFGHGETSAGFIVSDNIIANEVSMSDLNIIGEESVIPSIVCITPGEEVVISPSAYQIAKSKEMGISFKDPLIGSEEYPKISDSNYRYFKLFLSKTYESIKGNSNNPLHSSQDGENDFLVYIACPSGWNKEQIDAYKNFANESCNIPVVDIVKESRAAYIAARRSVDGGIRTQGGNILVIDYGSSTIDFTYFNNDSLFEPIHKGYKLGARIIEETFLNHLKKHESDARDNIALIEQKCGLTKGNNILLFKIRELKEEYFISPNQDRFLLSIDLSKILLDKSLRGRYIEPSNGDGYSKQELLDILSDYIKDLESMLDNFLTIGGVTSIDKVILTGGASRMFFFKDLVSKKYNVNKENHTLIVDLNPSVTISRGIAAFGFMNEKSETNEKPLWKNVNEFISTSLPNILRTSLNSAVADIYYNEFTQITNKYQAGQISDSSNRKNLDSLEDAFIEFLQSYMTSPETVGTKIKDSVEVSVSSAINEQLKAFCDTWNFKCDKINVSFDFNQSFYLPVETAKGVLEFMWNKCIEYINKRDFFGPTKNTPYRDRDYDDRRSIVSYLNSNFRTKCNKLHYDDDLSEELAVIEESIRTKVQEIIDNAKLEMYK